MYTNHQNSRRLGTQKHTTQISGCPDLIQYGTEFNIHKRTDISNPQQMNSNRNNFQSLGIIPDQSINAQPDLIQLGTELNITRRLDVPKRQQYSSYKNNFQSMCAIPDQKEQGSHPTTPKKKDLPQRRMTISSNDAIVLRFITSSSYKDLNFEQKKIQKTTLQNENIEHKTQQKTKQDSPEKKTNLNVALTLRFTKQRPPTIFYNQEVSNLESLHTNNKSNKVSESPQRKTEQSAFMIKSLKNFDFLKKKKRYNFFSTTNLLDTTEIDNSSTMNILSLNSKSINTTPRLELKSTRSFVKEIVQKAEVKKLIPRYYIDQIKKACQDMITTNVQENQFRIQANQSYLAMRSVRQIPMITQYEVNQKRIKMVEFNTDLFYNKTVVFDLDETLVHCLENSEQGYDKAIYVGPTKNSIIAYFNIRPYCQKVLEELSKICEVLIFTASYQQYAQKIIQYLDPKGKIFSALLFQDSCFNIGDSFSIKDLRVIPRDIKNIILIDNSAISYGTQTGNGIPILSFFNNKEDTQLLSLFEFLKQEILPLDDVRPFIKQYFKTSEYLNNKNGHCAVKNLY